jgi:hypothetical protein
MRKCLYIASILLVLMLGSELCSFFGTAVSRDQSPLLCILDDDHAEVKQGIQRDDSWTDLDYLTLTGMPVLTWSDKTELVLSLEGGEIVQPVSGIRLHRWLCRECC